MKNLVLTSAVLMVGLIIWLGGWFYVAQEEHVREISQTNLGAISRLKIDQITNWRNQLLKTAVLVSNDQNVYESIVEHRRQPSVETRDQVIEILSKTNILLNSKSVKIYNEALESLLHATDDTVIQPELGQSLSEAISMKQPVLSDLYHSQYLKRPVIDLVIPIPLENPLSFLVFSIDTGQFLYPLIQTWPGYSQTAETLLIRQENNSVLFLNNLRHRTGAALTLKISLQDEDVPAVMAVNGVEGLVEGTDYRGVPVLAVIKPVPDTDWFMITKIDLEEVFSNWQVRSILLFSLIFSGIAIVVTLVIVLWQRNQKVHYRSLLRTRVNLEQTEKALLKSSQNLQFVLNSANIGMWEWDAKTDKLRLDGIAQRLLGLETQQVDTLVKSLDWWLERVHPDDRHELLQLGAVFDSTENDHYLEFRCLHADDQFRWIEAHAGVRQTDEAGKATIINGMLKEITAQKQAQLALMKSEKRFRKVFNLLPIGLWIADENGALLTGNPAGVRIWGGEPLVGQDEYRVFKARRLPSGKEIEPDDWALVHTITRGITVENELLEIDAFDGVTRTILNFTSPILDEGGAVEGAIVLNLDVTREKEEEKARQKLEEELRQSQKLEAIGRLAGGIAHDFNNKLQTILGFANLAMDDAQPDTELHESLNEILKAASSSADLTRQLLTFARRQMIDPVTMNLNDEIKNLLKMLNHLIREEIELKLNPADDLWNIKIDPAQVDQILANMVVNSRDAIQGNGTITVSTENVTMTDLLEIPAGEYVCLKIADTGTGINPEHQDKIFEPFFTTKPMDQGTGLGLATVFGIMKQNKGYIRVKSTMGKGTVFSLYFPRSLDGILPTDTLEPDVLKPAQNSRILVVEDDAQLLNFCLKTLQKFGFMVIAESDPREALDYASSTETPIDLLITDVIMPELNGKQLWEQVRKYHPQCECLFISGYAADIISGHGVLDEDAYFLPKPFSIKQLSSKISEIL